MRIIAFIESACAGYVRQTGKILTHLGLWPTHIHSPPAGAPVAVFPATGRIAALSVDPGSGAVGCLGRCPRVLGVPRSRSGSPPFPLDSRVRCAGYSSPTRGCGLTALVRLMWGSCPGPRRGRGAGPGRIAPEPRKANSYHLTHQFPRSLNGASPLRNAIQTVLIGVVTAGVAFMIARAIS